MGKVLITGGSGLLGSNLAEIFCKDFEVFIIFNKNPVKIDYCNEMKIDLIDFENVEKIIKKINPLIIIHCAALTNVDYCEKNPKEAKEINCDSTKNLARIGKEIGAKFIYISTDSIFDGETGGYSENDIPNPINVYAKTKLEGEEEVRKINGNYIIIRTNIYGKNKIQKFSLAEWMLDKLEKNEEFFGFEDIIFNPILIDNLGEIIKEICEKDIRGTYNIASPEKCSKLEFGRKIAKIFDLNRDKIKPTSSKVMNFYAKRPKKTDLKIEKIRKMVDTKILDIEEGLRKFKEKIGD